MPSPLPLANSGLGIYGVGGLFGANAALPTAPPGKDPIEFALEWRPEGTNTTVCRRGGTVIGLGAVIGTVPDLGYAFSAKAMVIVGVPDGTVRASLEGKAMGGRYLMSDLGTTGPAVGLRWLGLLVIDPAAVTLALRGEYSIPVLLNVTVPIGAHFPRNASKGWYVHLGADGYGTPRRGPGPISARVLPDLLDVGAWAYLMIHGDGLDDLGGNATFDLYGFAIGLGFGFKARYGVIITLDLSASAAIGLGVDPLMLIGKGNLTGTLNLGPISIGASADIDLQVGPGNVRWATFRVCGEVDCFFFSVSGCVEIEIGTQAVDIPAPDAWPLQRLSLADRTYRELETGSATSAQAPTVWPDVVPILSFSTGPAPSTEPAFLDGPFAKALTANGTTWNGTVGGDGRTGSHDLRYTYSLTRLDLLEVNETTGAETVVTSIVRPGDGLMAAWQVPKHGDPAASTALGGQRELALLTWEPHVWTRRLITGGKDLPDDPLGPIADGCRIRWEARAGWALGGQAAPDDGALWRLPPETAPGERFVARFAVDVTATLGGTPLDTLTQWLPLTPFPLALGGPGPLPQPVGIADRVFAGRLDLPRLAIAGEDARMAFQRQFMMRRRLPLRAIEVFLGFDEALREPALVLLGDETLAEVVQVEGVREDGTTAPWDPIEDAWTADGRLALTFASPGGAFAGAWVRYVPYATVALLGVRGITLRAIADAGAATSAAQEGAAATAKIKLIGRGKRRDLLKAGVLYKLVVGQRAVGARPDGTSKQFDAPETTYWFQTATKPSQQRTSPPTGQMALTQILGTVDHFDPMYLQRYLAGWLPGDRTEHWFCDDPVAAHFSVDYIVELCRLYERGVEVRVRRTDTPPGQPDEAGTVFTTTSLVASLIGAPESDVRLVQMTANAVEVCGVPEPGGGSMGGVAPLVKRARYDLAVAFPVLDATGHTVPGTGDLLPGITFETSRWRTPADMLNDLGFGDGTATVTGDLPVTPAGLTGTVTGDGALHDALITLGLQGWPVAREARTSALWTPVATAAGPEWRLCGVLIESPEPIDRTDTLGYPGFGGRIRTGGLRCGGTAFDIVRRDDTGTRLLYLTATPLVPTGPLELDVTGQKITVTSAGTPPAATTRTVRCAVDAAPAFAEQLS
jgi:hypothetical protein